MSRQRGRGFHNSSKHVMVNRLGTLTGRGRVRSFAGTIDPFRVRQLFHRQAASSVCSPDSPFRCDNYVSVPRQLFLPLSPCRHAKHAVISRQLSPLSFLTTLRTTTSNSIMKHGTLSAIVSARCFDVGERFFRSGNRPAHDEAMSGKISSEKE